MALRDSGSIEQAGRDEVATEGEDAHSQPDWPTLARIVVQGGQTGKPDHSEVQQVWDQRPTEPMGGILKMNDIRLCGAQLMQQGRNVS
jgi:hypothetical protein